MASCGGGWDSTTKNYTPVDQLIFADTALAACINTEVTNKGYRFAYEIEELSCNNAGIISLAGIEALSSLKIINLNFNQIWDITPLAGLSELMHIGLVQNNIADISNLSALKKLSKLYLIYNNIEDLSGLSESASLTELYLSANLVADVSPLSGLSEIKILDLRSNNFAGTNGGNIDHLSGLVNLTQLFLGANQDMSCQQLQTLLDSLGSPPVDLDGNIATQDSALAGSNCTLYLSVFP